MAIEVEQKFRIADPSGLRRQLAALGINEAETMIQADYYFAHPVRDFANTDEALRLRQVGDLNYITYKGPKLDATTKTRREIEIALPPGAPAAAEAGSLLEALGFTRVAEVRKRRIHYTFVWQEQPMSAALDHIDELGDFIELEIVTDPGNVPAARDRLASLARQLGLTDSERRSYLELLLEARQ